MVDQLSQPAFWILTALAGQRRHGYEILHETASVSEGRVSLKVTTLYATLERLQQEGLIHADGEEVVEGRARRYYRITDGGSARLAEEVRALEQSVRVAREHLAVGRLSTAPFATLTPKIGLA